MASLAILFDSASPVTGAALSDGPAELGVAGSAPGFAAGIGVRPPRAIGVAAPICVAGAMAASCPA